jgi:hypothetical protein
MQGEHYKTFSTWLERIGLLALASLVVPKIFIEASFADNVLIFGTMITIVAYLSASLLLIKS